MKIKTSHVLVMAIIGILSITNVYAQDGPRILGVPEELKDFSTDKVSWLDVQDYWSEVLEAGGMTMADSLVVPSIEYLVERLRQAEAIVAKKKLGYLAGDYAILITESVEYLTRSRDQITDLACFAGHLEFLLLAGRAVPHLQRQSVVDELLEYYADTHVVRDLVSEYRAGKAPVRVGKGLLDRSENFDVYEQVIHDEVWNMLYGSGMDGLRRLHELITRAYELHVQYLQQPSRSGQMALSRIYRDHRQYVPVGWTATGYAWFGFGFAVAMVVVASLVEGILHWVQENGLARARKKSQERDESS